MKHFNCHWNFGNITTICGETIEDAFHRAGYGGGIIRTLDYWEEAKEVSMDNKKIVLVEDDKRTEISRGTLFAKQILEQIADGAKRVVASVVGNKWICDVEIMPFEIVCNCVALTKRSGEQVVFRPVIL